MKLKDLKRPFFEIMNLEYEFDMDEVQAMWEALLLHHNIPTPDNWDAFISDVNCMAAVHYKFFAETFEKHLEEFEIGDFEDEKNNP